MDAAIGLLMVALLLGLVALVVTALVSASRIELDRWHVAGRSKGVTIALIFVTGGIGGLYYWLRIRPELRPRYRRRRPHTTTLQSRTGPTTRVQSDLTRGAGQRGPARMKPPTQERIRSP